MTYISWFSDYTPPHKKYVEGYIVYVFPSVRPSFHAFMLHCDLYFMVHNIGTPKTINFPFGTNEKLMVLGIPILMNFGVSEWSEWSKT